MGKWREGEVFEEVSTERLQRCLTTFYGADEIMNNHIFLFAFAPSSLSTKTPGVGRHCVRRMLGCRLCSRCVLEGSLRGGVTFVFSEELRTKGSTEGSAKGDAKEFPSEKFLTPHVVVREAKEFALADEVLLPEGAAELELTPESSSQSDRRMRRVRMIRKNIKNQEQHLNDK
ncbi:transglutaminase domain-containing protein [Anopheles sinensis]|uniref:Transglutaminase domain-containing protein n=1 Tax=Anopheles sinensis TaxID=74873 RepID=A0A084WME4_ANOSI|nr:transglutaminase domain-containing protein [Anopheles sinensis]